MRLKQCFGGNEHGDFTPCRATTGVRPWIASLVMRLRCRRSSVHAGALQ